MIKKKEKMNCDLHSHTVHSDGSYTPRELVLAAKEKNLIIALTDHNTASGLAEFLREAEREGVTAVGGSELSTDYRGREFHLIGLFIEPEHYEKLESLCNGFLELKELSNIDLVNKLAGAGYRIDYERVRQRNIKGKANRAHIAAELVKCGYVSSVSEAFEKLLHERCGYYVPPKRLDVSDAIRFLKSIGAVTVLAHPLKEIGGEELRLMLPELISAGLDAIETMHSSYTEEQIALSKAIAAEFDLLESGGSDFHGAMKPGVDLGTGKGNLNIPEVIYHKLLDRKMENQ